MSDACTSGWRPASLNAMPPEEMRSPSPATRRLPHLFPPQPLEDAAAVTATVAATRLPQPSPPRFPWTSICHRRLPAQRETRLLKRIRLYRCCHRLRQQHQRLRQLPHPWLICLKLNRPMLLHPLSEPARPQNRGVRWNYWVVTRMGNFTRPLSPAHHIHRLTRRKHLHSQLKLHFPPPLEHPSHLSSWWWRRLRQLEGCTDIPGSANIACIATANSIQGDPNIAPACTASPMPASSTTPSPPPSLPTLTSSTMPSPTPSPPSYCALPTPPPIGKLPTS